MIEYKNIRLCDLSDFVGSELFSKLDELPITTRRALAQQKNPYGQPDDVVLIIAYDQNKLLGYIGILPDQLFSADAAVRFGWISCWRVVEGCKGNVALNLLLKALKAWDYRIMSTDLIPHTRNLLKQSKVFLFTELDKGIRLYLRFCLADVLPAKHSIFKKIKPLLSLADSLLNFFYGLKPPKKYIEDFSIQELKTTYEIAPELLNDKQLIRFDNERLNWIAQYTWIGATEKDKSEQKRYYFSSFEKNFSQRFFILKDRSNSKALIWLTIRNGHLKTSGLWYPQSMKEIVIRFLLVFAYSNKIKSLTTFNPEIVSILSSKEILSISKRNLYRDLCYTSALKELLPERPLLQDAAGDYAFT